LDNEVIALTFDANGNLASDGLRNYTWDGENRLVGITYPGQTGKATTFTYDGLSRRTAIASTPTGGGSAATTSYIWCSARICQARNSSNSVTRKYYDEGEVVPGSPAQPYYYGVDQLGSVRRAFASTSSAPASSYDPYGKPLQGTAPLTDFNYARMFFNSDSGLYLTLYRAFDPVVGRWLSRDPIGEMSDKPNSTIPYFLTGGVRSDVRFMQISGQSDGHGDPGWLKNGLNLYAYVKNEPIYLSDPNGLFPWIGSGGGLGGSNCYPGAPDEPPFGTTPGGEPVDPAGWHRCLIALCVIAGMNNPIEASKPSMDDLAPQVEIKDPAPWPWKRK
jgi:RHS repeat-associated protein